MAYAYLGFMKWLGVATDLRWTGWMPRVAAGLNATGSGLYGLFNDQDLGLRERMVDLASKIRFGTSTLGPKPPRLEDAEWKGDHHVGDTMLLADMFEPGKRKNFEELSTHTFESKDGTTVRQLKTKCAEGHCRWEIREAFVKNGSEPNDAKLEVVDSGVIADSQLGALKEPVDTPPSGSKLQSSISQGTVISSAHTDTRTTAYILDGSGTARFVSEELKAKKSATVEQSDTIASFDRSKRRPRFGPDACDQNQRLHTASPRRYWEPHARRCRRSFGTNDR